MQATSKGGIYFFAGLGVATTYLGVWQAQRYSWKKDLIAKNTEKFHLPCHEIKSFEPDM
jgi:cytochrome oxidase assembly protein ShyY1